MQRFTIKGLREFVNFVNETVPKMDGAHFDVMSYNGYHRIVIKADAPKSWVQDTHTHGGTPREVVHEFENWLVSSSCPRESVLAVFDYIVFNRI